MATTDYDTPSSLVGIARAAHLAGNRELERAMRQKLLESWGMRLTFTRSAKAMNRGTAGPYA